jgi:hypothetical protein
MTPKVYVDTTVLKFSATQLRRLHPKTQQVNWGSQDHQMTVYGFVHVNPNDSIVNPELKAEAALLPSLAKAGKTGVVNYVIQDETLFESWGIPKMNSETGKFYDAPCENVEAPIKYSRALVGAGFDARDTQFRFLSSINSKRFLELQKMTGAYQGPGKLNRKQLLDAFYLWCAEHNDCDYFLTLDFKLIKVLRKQKSRLLCEVVRPSELMNRIGLST